MNLHWLQQGRGRKWESSFINDTDFLDNSKFAPWKLCFFINLTSEILSFIDLFFLDTEILFNLDNKKDI